MSLLSLALLALALRFGFARRLANCLRIPLHQVLVGDNLRTLLELDAEVTAEEMTL
jgi:hypothetical protein